MTDAKYKEKLSRDDIQRMGVYMISAQCRAAAGYGMHEAPEAMLFVVDRDGEREICVPSSRMERMKDFPDIWIYPIRLPRFSDR